MLEISWLINGMNVIGAQSAGTVDVYVNGSQAANDVNFFSAVLPVGAYYEIRDIKALSGYTYGGISFGSTLGMISGDTSVRLIFNSVAPTPTPTPIA